MSSENNKEEIPAEPGLFKTKFKKKIESLIHNGHSQLPQKLFPEESLKNSKKINNNNTLTNFPKETEKILIEVLKEIAQKNIEVHETEDYNEGLLTGYFNHFLIVTTDTKKYPNAKQKVFAIKLRKRTSPDHYVHKEKHWENQSEKKDLKNGAIPFEIKFYYNLPFLNEDFSHIIPVKNPITR